MTRDHIAGVTGSSGEHIVPCRAFILLLALLSVASESGAGEEWDFDDLTIRESTPVFERSAISTAGRPYVMIQVGHALPMLISYVPVLHNGDRASGRGLVRTGETYLVGTMQA